MKQILIICAFMAILCSVNFAEAQQTIVQKPTPLIPKIEAYFAGLNTAQADFKQTAPDGTQSTGKFYLSRPGKLRFQYDKPLTDFVVADGLFIYFYDGQLKQQTNAPISQTLADFILRKNLKLSGDLKVTKAQRGGGLLQVTMVQTSDPLSGSLTLGFTESPALSLKKWRVTDATGAITEIELFNLKRGVKLDKKLFRYIDPNPRGLN